MPFILSLIYLLYLSLICQTLVIYDSIGYEVLGKNLLQHGIITYIQNGPEREPIYPLLIAAAMRLAEVFSLDFRWVLKLLHMGTLVLTQILAFILMQGLRIKKPWRTLAILYIGISPVLVNGTLWIYSEIAALPFVLLIVILAGRAWRGLEHPAPTLQHVVNGVLLGSSLALTTLVKGIFEVIAPILVLPFIFLTVKSFRQNPQNFKQALIVTVCILCSFYVPITAYKFANKLLNGHYALTDRGPWALYGNTARRAEPLTLKRFKAAVVYAVNPHACSAVLDQNDCDFWSYKSSDYYGRDKLQQLVSTGLPAQAIDQKLFSLSIQKAMEHPFQYTLLASIEAMKMLFWETTKAGQVTYPDWLDNFYNARWSEPLFVALSAFLSLLGLAGLARAVWRTRNNFWTPSYNYREALMFFTLLMLLAYAGVHSLFFVLQRYAIPLGPLWIITIAFYFSEQFGKAKTQQ